MQLMQYIPTDIMLDMRKVKKIIMVQVINLAIIMDGQKVTLLVLRLPEVN